MKGETFAWKKINNFLWTQRVTLSWCTWNDENTIVQVYSLEKFQSLINLFYNGAVEWCVANQRHRTKMHKNFNNFEETYQRQRNPTEIAK